MTEKRDTRVNEIIDAAISEFIEKGYRDASMESIARRAKLSKGGLYHHFGSKAEILFMVNVKSMEPIQNFMYKIETGKSVVKGLNQFVRDYISYWNRHRKELSLYFLTMNESFSDEKIMGMYTESTRQNFVFFESLFLKGQKTGVFKKCPARAHAISFLSCLDGFLGYLLIDPSISTEDIIKEIQRTFITDLTK
jgi:AcrR family transcriptional regulator